MSDKATGPRRPGDARLDDATSAPPPEEADPEAKPAALSDAAPAPATPEGPDGTGRGDRSGGMEGEGAAGG